MKVPALVAGADSIDDMDLWRHGAVNRLFTDVGAPSTLGMFLRTFTFGSSTRLPSGCGSIDARSAGRQPGDGRLAGSIGSLLLGLPGNKALRYAGTVRTGFTDRSPRELTELLEPLRSNTSPSVEAVPRRDAVGAVWVRPTVVGGAGGPVHRVDPPGRLPQPAWRGLRP